jgi:hypothetical protein
VLFNRYINTYELKWITLNAILYCGLILVKQCVIMLYKIKALRYLKGKLHFTLSVTSVTGVNWIEVAVWTVITLKLCKVVGVGVGRWRWRGRAREMSVTCSLRRHTVVKDNTAVCMCHHSCA